MNVIKNMRWYCWIGTVVILAIVLNFLAKI